jgi:hypothetical protein
MPEDIKPVEPQVTPEIPKNKEEWAKLAKDDPGKFAELTQTRMDTFFRQNKEFQEKLNLAEQREKNLSLELERLKQPVQMPVQQGEKYGPGRYPQSEDEWNDLFLERPAYATDLRNTFLNEQNTYKNDFIKTREEGVKQVWKELPTMFLPELDENNKPKVDGQGKPVLKINPQDGTPYFNAESEDGKLWLKIYNEDREVWDRDKNLPLHILAEVERRKRQKGATMVNQGQNNLENNDQSGLAPQGVTPPKAGSSKYRSDEERQRAQQAIARGVYKSEDEFFKWRDTDEHTGYVDKNSRPDFSKR